MTYNSSKGFSVIRVGGMVPVRSENECIEKLKSPGKSGNGSGKLPGIANVDSSQSTGINKVLV